MTKLSSDVDPKLSDVVIQQLQRKRVCTVIEFIEEDSEKLATCTGLSLKVQYVCLLRKTSTIHVSRWNVGSRETM